MAYLDNVKSGFGLARQWYGGSRPIASKAFLDRNILRAFKSDILSQKMTRVQPMRMIGGGSGPKPIKLKNVFNDASSSSLPRSLKPLPELPPI